MTRLKDYWGLLLALLLTAVTLFPYSAVELGRDQANWLTVAMAIEHGSVMYRDVAVVNTPGLGILFYGINALFGTPLLTPWIAHYLAVMAALIAGYAWVRRFCGAAEATCAVLLSAALWPLSMDWWEIAQKDGIAFALALGSAAALAYGDQRRGLDILAGALFAAAVLFKTSAALYAAPLGLQLALSCNNFRTFLNRGLLAAAGSCGLILLPIAYLVAHDAWASAWGSLFERASAYGGFQRTTNVEILRQLFIKTVRALSFAVFLPLLMLWKRPAGAGHFLPLAGMVLTTAVLFFLQGRGWAYHAVPFVAAFAITCGACLGEIMRAEPRWKKILAIVLVVAALAFAWGNTQRNWYKYVDYLRGNLSAAEYADIFRVSGMATHEEARQIGEWIRLNSSVDDRIFVWGMESQIYLHADRMFIGPSFADAPIWHPQLAVQKPDYYNRQRQRFYQALQETPPTFFVIVRNDANPVEPTPSDQSLDSLPEIVNFLQSNYVRVMETEHLLLLHHNAGNN